MSLAIDVDTVTDVLLADCWHPVTDRSFDLDAYEFLYESRLLVGGGDEAGVPSTGFTFTTDTGDRLTGPLTAILALKHTDGEA